MTTGQDIVTQARSWLGTRFHHQGRVKATQEHKGGCDCIGLVIGVLKELDIHGRDGTPLWQYDQTGYGKFPDGQALQQALRKHLHIIPEEQLQPGDIALFLFEEEPQHVVIISDYEDGLGMIHCYASARKVVEHRMDTLWQGRLVEGYGLFF